LRGSKKIHAILRKRSNGMLKDKNILSCDFIEVKIIRSQQWQLKNGNE